jgi:septal ring factor EnvC (AmiA/AmiB activator)
MMAIEKRCKVCGETALSYAYYCREHWREYNRNQYHRDSCAKKPLREKLDHANKERAALRKTIAAMEARIAEWEKIIREREQYIASLEKQVERIARRVSA